MKGRKPKPTARKLLDGNPGQRPVNRDEPKPLGELGEAPPELDSDAKRLWFRLLPEVKAMGAGSIDETVLSMLCQAVSRWWASERIIARDGLTTEGPKGGLVKHPAVNIARESMLLAHKLGSEFGLSPASRARLFAPKPAGEGDEFEQYLKLAGE